MQNQLPIVVPNGETIAEILERDPTLWAEPDLAALVRFLRKSRERFQAAATEASAKGTKIRTTKPKAALPAEIANLEIEL